MTRTLSGKSSHFRPQNALAAPDALAADALVLNVREGGRVVNVHQLRARPVSGDLAHLFVLPKQMRRSKRQVTAWAVWLDRGHPRRTMTIKVSQGS